MAYTVVENGSAFDRGVAAGEIGQRLKEHDAHLAKINGSMADVARRLETQGVTLGEMKMQVQRMADAMTADRATVATTADAVEKERASTATAVEKERTTLRDSTERRWSPLSRIGITVGILGGLAALVTTILLATGH